MVKLLALLPLLAAVSAVPVEERAAGPSVTIQNGTVVGSTSSGIDSFKGVPFAQPPTGNLRLRPPQSITKSFGTLTATGTPTACPQFYSQVNTTNLPSEVVGLITDLPFFQEITNTGEDCLTLNVQRPAGTTASSKLPVLFWIYGGGFEFGSTQTYDGSSIVSKSVSLGKPIIYVAVNYRVAGFGFMPGKELSAEKSTNLGLRDQRLGMEWVQDNIAKFGGDPTRVTIWGESAGSISVFDHTIINGGDISYKGKPLFRGAMMDSGSVVSADPVTAPQAQAVYDYVVNAAGCGGKSDTLSCLRALPYETFLKAANSVPSILSFRALDLSYLPRPDPSDNFFAVSPDISVANGKYAKVPIIIGDQEDEGTLFSLEQFNLTTGGDVAKYLATYFPGNPNALKDVQGLLALYPDDPFVGQPDGSPFGTGPLNDIYPEFKRLAAVLGDITFTLTRRNYLDTVSTTVPSWSYLSSYFFGTPILGTFHATDILYAYGLLGSAQPITNTIQQYYISFVNDLNPNSLGTPSPMINWPKYTPSSPQLLNLQQLQNVLLPDNFRLAASKYLAKFTTSFRV